MPSRRRRAAVLAAAALAAAFTVTACVRAAGLYTAVRPGPFPPALDVMLALLGALASLEALWWWHCRRASSGPSCLAGCAHPLSRGNVARACRRGTSLVSVAAALVLAICYGICRRPDGAALAGLLCAALALVAAPAWRHADGDAGGGGDDDGKAASSYRSLNADADGVLAAAAAMPPAAAAAATSCCTRTCCAPAGTRPSAALVCGAHAALWALCSAALLLLLGGAGTQASGYLRFPPRGAFYDLALPGGGATQRVHAWCTGAAANASWPTVWLDIGGGGHSMSDGYGLQFALNRRGLRVCTHDPPGTGWSPLGALAADSRSDARGPPALTAALVAALGEAGAPLVAVGTMDGGAARIYALALAQPAMVRALVPMQYGEGEFVTQAAYHGWSAAAAAPVAAATLRGRLALCDAIRFLAVQWGIVAFFAPASPTFVPADAQAECHFLNLYQESQWDYQCRMLAAQAADPTNTVLAPDIWAADRTLRADIPVLAIDATPADPCADAGLPPGGDACAEARFSAARGVAFMMNMTAMTPGSVYRECVGLDGASPAACKDWLGSGSTVEPVASAIASFIAALPPRT